MQSQKTAETAQTDVLPFPDPVPPSPTQAEADLLKQGLPLPPPPEQRRDMQPEPAGRYRTR
jgi:hypothetical protein